MTQTDWLSRLDAVLDAHDRRGGFLLRLPEYRPDLARRFAARAGVEHVDFRALRMAPLGAGAAALGFDALDAEIAARDDGVLLQNAEALLALRAADERAAWLGGFLSIEARAPVLIPLALFGEDAPEHPRVLSFAAEDVPEESVLMRLVEG